MTAFEAIEDLHARCAVFTTPETASRLLDSVGWTEQADLSVSTLLEPCAGEGAILLEAARRLVGSLRRRGLPLVPAVLGPRLVSFELHQPTAAVARCALVNLLTGEGIERDIALALADTWLKHADFLLRTPASATHVVANPPYVRWSKLPPALASLYRKRLRPLATRGDIAVAFLDRMLAWLVPEGELVALVSDRWMYAQYGAEFVDDCARRGWKIEVLDERPDRPFVRLVGAYSAVVRLRSGTGGPPAARPRDAARALHAGLVRRHGTLADAGCRVRVGPALGCGDSFVVPAHEARLLEPEVIRHLTTRADLVGDAVARGSTLVAVPWGSDGRLLALTDVPRFAGWIASRRERLEKRSCIKQGRHWWRTIDAIGLDWRQQPKLLVAELCRVATAHLDTTDALPAHSIYAIWPGEWPVETLQRVLNAGLLALTAEAEAPALKHGWFRLYRRFLVRTPLPRWPALALDDRVGLSSANEAVFAATFRRLFGFAPDGLLAAISVE